MEIYYQGVDITGSVQIRSCVARDGSDGRCDSLDIEFEDAALWYSWGPEEDDRVLVSHGGYDSGIMYVNSVLPSDGRYRILATALPCRARARAWRSWRDKTLEEILRACALADGMEYALYGVDGGTRYAYIEQADEGGAAFLHRLLRLEGASLKCVNGRYAAIGIAWAQTQNPVATIRLDSRQNGADYRRTHAKYARAYVRAPLGSGSAEDTAAHGLERTWSEVPARGDIQAARWARGLLLDYNRKCEALRLTTAYNPNYTALMRVDVAGDTDANGSWLIDSVEHDFKRLESTALMYRCVDSVR